MYCNIFYSLFILLFAYVPYVIANDSDTKRLDGINIIVAFWPGVLFIGILIFPFFLIYKTQLALIKFIKNKTSVKEKQVDDVKSDYRNIEFKDSK